MIIDKLCSSILVGVMRTYITWSIALLTHMALQVHRNSEIGRCTLEVSGIYSYVGHRLTTGEL